MKKKIKFSTDEIKVPIDSIKVNTSFDNLVYWAKKVLKFWEKEVKIDIDLPDTEKIFILSHDHNMAFNQFIEEVLLLHIKKLKEEVTPYKKTKKKK